MDQTNKRLTPIPMGENLRMSIRFWEVVSALLYPSDLSLEKSSRFYRGKDLRRSYVMSVLGDKGLVAKLDYLYAKVGLLVCIFASMGCT